MKTPEEFVIAIDEMIKEATNSGFVLVIGFDDGDNAFMTGTGNALHCIGLADALYNHAKKRMKKAK